MSERLGFGALPIYAGLPARKVVTMRPIDVVFAELLAERRAHAAQK